MSERPIYELYIDAKGCYFELFINEIPFYFHYKIGATAFRLPINSFIPHSGEQRISLNMITVLEAPEFPQGAQITLKIETYEKGMPRERRPVFEYRTPSLNEKKTALFKDKKIFSADVPYTLTLSHSEDLRNIKEELLKKELESLYREYTDAFKNNDLQKYQQLTAERQENIFTSLYYDGDARKKQEQGYLKGVNHTQVKLYPLINYKLVFYDNYKLAGLSLLKEAPGVYIDSEKEEDAFIEYILFHKKDPKSPMTIVL